MVYCFTSDVSGNTEYFLYDVESGSLHNVDKSAYLVAKQKYSSLTDEEFLSYGLLTKAETEEIDSELSELERQGVLNSPATVYNLNCTGEIKALCLHICHDCNLRCPYCFAKDGTYNTPKDYMTFEVGAAAIDFLIEKSKNRQNLEVDFFGGEPLMNMGVVKRIVEYANEKVKEAGKSIHFTMTTNGVLLGEENRRWLNDNMFNVVISIDGRPEVHDKLRVTPNHKGCQALVLENAKEFRKIRGDKSYYIRGTFTANNLDFSKDVLYLNDEGFDQISVEPVVLPQSDPLAIKEEDMDKVLAEYDVLAKEYIKRRKTDKWFNFFHFMIDLKQGPCVYKRLRGCGAGNEYVAVTPTGDIYPCHQFAGQTEYKMGSVLDRTFDTNAQKRFAECTVYTKKGCSDCVAKYHCSGGCNANAVHFSGDINTPYKEACAMMRKRFLTSLAIYAAENADG
ncbi:radical SAM domain protein [Acidaminococcus sp. CAG:917]|nr:radical SAM domain protein [Acidaminococcus sp. CAG:917]